MNNPMDAPQRVTTVFLDVIEYLSEHTEGVYGHVIVKETRNKFGSAYSVLRRLLDADWVTVSLDGHGKPVRPKYTLTPHGAKAAARLLAERRPPATRTTG